MIVIIIIITEDDRKILFSHSTSRLQPNTNFFTFKLKRFFTLRAWTNSWCDLMPDYSRKVMQRQEIDGIFIDFRHLMYTNFLRYTEGWHVRALSYSTQFRCVLEWKIIFKKIFGSGRSINNIKAHIKVFIWCKFNVDE